jgi:hypothetical protein
MGSALRILHRLVNDLDRLMLRVYAVLVDHVPAPVVLARERLATQHGIRAALFCAVVLAAFAVLVVDVTVEMCSGAEAFAAAGDCALVWPLMVAFVVA